MGHSQESSDDEGDVNLSAVAQQHCIVVQAAERSADARLGCSMQGRIVKKDHNRGQGHERLIEDYFVENPTYNTVDVSRWFRISRPLFLLIMDTVQQIGSYFAQKPDATGPMGISVLHKCTLKMRQLAYGVSPDSLDKSLPMAESTGRERLRRLVAAIVQAFGERYLRQPNLQDVQRLLAENEARGFPGMFSF